MLRIAGAMMSPVPSSRRVSAYALPTAEPSWPSEPYRPPMILF
jgi:hypothetical protein